MPMLAVGGGPAQNIRLLMGSCCWLTVWHDGVACELLIEGSESQRALMFSRRIRGGFKRGGLSSERFQGKAGPGSPERHTGLVLVVGSATTSSSSRHFWLLVVVVPDSDTV